MQDDKRDELINKAVEASLAIDGDSAGKDGANPWKPKTTPETKSDNNSKETAAAPTPAAATAPSTPSPAAAASTVNTPSTPVAPSPISTGPAAGSSAAPPLGAVSAGSAESKNVDIIKPQGPVGIDLGSSSVVVAEGREKKIHHVPFNSTISFENFHKNVVIEHEVPYFDINNLDYVQGYGADAIANSFHSHPWRPVPSEFSTDQEGTVLGETILQTIIGRPGAPATPLFFTVPAPALGDENSNVFAKGTLKSFFSRFGYIAMPVDKGVAVAMSELGNDNYTGLVISVGASVTNITLTYLSVPILNFTIPKAGDYIDKMVAQSTSELQFKVKEIKEKSFSILAKPSTRVLSGLRIYHEDVLTSIIKAIANALGEKQPANINAPIPVILSGGSAKPDGFQLLFEKVLEKFRLPLAISEVRVAKEPSFAAAKGALFLANSEDL